MALTSGSVSNSTSSTSAASQATKSAATSLITKLGTGSGVDMVSLAQNLVDAEKAPRSDSINRNISKSEARISGYAAMMASLGMVRSAFEALQSPSKVDLVASTSSLSSAVAVTSTTGASPGVHEIEVKHRAQAQRSLSPRFSSETVSLNGGNRFILRLDMDGKSKGIEIPEGKTTPKGIVQAIKDANIGLNAQLVNTGDGSASPYQIVVTGPTGAKNSFSFTTDDGNGVSEQQTISFRNAISSGTLSIGGITVDVTQGETKEVITARVKAALDADALKNGTGRIFTDNTDGTLTITYAATEGDVPTEVYTDASNSITAVSTTRSFVAGAELTTGATKTQKWTFGAATEPGTVTINPSGSLAFSAVTVSIAAGDTAAVITQNVKDALELASPGRFSIASDGSLQANYTEADGDASLAFSITPDDPNQIPADVMTDPVESVTQAYVARTSPTTLNFSNHLQSAGDAELVIDGVTIFRSENVVSDAVAGLKIDLLNVTQANAPAVITLNRDTGALKEKVAALVKSYNDAMSDFAILSGPKNKDDPEDVYSGSLANDSTIRLVKTQVRDLFLGDSRSPGKNYRALRDLGISIDKTGVLQFDQNKFSEATSKNFDDVVTFLTNNTETKSAFTSAAQGLAGDAVKRLNDMTRPTGFIQSQSFSAQKDVDRYKLDLEKLDERMKKLLERYTKTFSTLDSFVGQANSTMSRLKSTFDAMNGSNN